MTRHNQAIARPEAPELAVSEVFGTVLILGIVITGIGLILILTSGVIADSKTDAKYSSTEQAFTMADSRISKARFGTAISQEAPFTLRDGNITIDGSPANSYIMVYGIDGTNPVYEGPLGTIKCDLGDTEIAYQGGGVFSSDKAGNSVVLSPPDFDYNGVTLTLPIMQIQGSDTIAASDNSQIVIGVTSADYIDVVYPLYEPSKVGTLQEKINPIPAGYTIKIVIKSDYYKAWASYIQERTGITPTTNDATKEMTVLLATGRVVQSGDLQDGFDTGGMETSYTSPVDIFKLNLELRNTGNDHSITYGRDGNNPYPQLKISVSRTTGNDNKEYAYISYEYTHVVDPVTNQIDTETFEGYIPFARKTDGKMDLDMLSDSTRLKLVNAPGGTVNGVTNSWGSDPDLQYIQPGILDYDNSITDYNDPADDIAIGGTKTLNDLSQHYFRIMAQSNPSGPKYDIITRNTYDGGTSTFKFGFKSGQDIKYMYITKGVMQTTLSTSSN